MSEYDKTTFKLDNYSYNEEYTAESMTYPKILELEEMANVNDNGYGTLGISEQNEYIEQSSLIEAKTLTFKQRFYYYTMSTSYMDELFYELFTCGSSSTSHEAYWLASRGRYESILINYIYGLYSVSEGRVNVNRVYTQNNSNGGALAVRPVVDIDLKSVYIGESGHGTIDLPYSIEEK